MAACVCQHSCAFYRGEMANMPPTVDLYKHAYCSNDGIGCARYQVAMLMGTASVPDDLLPNSGERAQARLEGHGYALS